MFIPHLRSARASGTSSCSRVPSACPEALPRGGRSWWGGSHLLCGQGVGPTVAECWASQASMRLGGSHRPDPRRGPYGGRGGSGDYTLGLGRWNTVGRVRGRRQGLAGASWPLPPHLSCAQGFATQTMVGCRAGGWGASETRLGGTTRQCLGLPWPWLAGCPGPCPALPVCSLVPLLVGGAALLPTHPARPWAQCWELVGLGLYRGPQCCSSELSHGDSTLQAGSGARPGDGLLGKASVIWAVWEDPREPGVRRGCGHKAHGSHCG